MYNTTGGNKMDILPNFLKFMVKNTLRRAKLVRIYCTYGQTIILPVITKIAS